MISAYLTKIKMYIGAGLLVAIITLLVFIGSQYVRIVALEKNVGDLKIENKRAWQEYDFAQKKIEIQNQFSNSTTTINEITNEIIFSSNKQIAINEIIKDYYKQIKK